MDVHRKENLTYPFFLHHKNARKRVKRIPHLYEHRINKILHMCFYVKARLKKSPLPRTNDAYIF